MHTMLRLSICALAVAGVIYGLDLAHPGWIQDLGHETVYLAEFSVQLENEAQIKDNYEDRLNTARIRMATKHEIARRLIAEQLSLCEAAALFRDLDRHFPNGCIAIFRQYIEGRTDDERYCRQVIGAAEGELFRQPHEAAAIRARLNAELQEMLERGPVHLSLGER